MKSPTHASYIAATLLVSCLVTLSAPSTAQTPRPDKPIRIVVPYTPGGGTDVITRHITEKITQETKWAFIVDNKPGGNGNIGVDLVAKAKPDGYTIAMDQTSNLAINPAVMAKLPFDAAKDFIPVALLAELKTLADMVKAAKARPGQVRQALAGTGTVGHLAGEMLAKKAGFSVLNVPYKGAAPAMTDLLGGLTDYMFATPQAVLGMLQGGKLRALAVTSAKRVGSWAAVPTVAEQGFSGFAAVDWKVIVAPPGTPADIVKRLYAATAKALTQPALLQKLADEASAPLSGSPQEVAAYINSEQAKWGALIHTYGIKFD